MSTGPASSTPCVAVIVLTWNSADCIERCLTSVLTSSEPITVMVVDNASADATCEIVRTRFPSVELVETGENLGYSAGNNVAIRAALARSFEHVLLLNPDAYIAEDTVAQLRQWLHAHPEAGGASPLIRYADSDRVWYAGSEIRWADGATLQIGQGDDDAQLPTSPTPTGRLNGCAMMLRAEAIAQVGDLDEDYFLYYEETDLSVRLSDAGWWLWLVPAARCWHAASSSTGGFAGRTYQYYMTRGRFLFLRKHAAGRVRWPQVGRLMLREVLWIRRTNGVRTAWSSARLKARAARDFRAGRVGRVTL